MYFFRVLKVFRGFQMGFNRVFMLFKDLYGFLRVFNFFSKVFEGFQLFINGFLMVFQ